MDYFESFASFYYELHSRCNQGVVANANALVQACKAMDERMLVHDSKWQRWSEKILIPNEMVSTL